MAHRYHSFVYIYVTVSNPLVRLLFFIVGLILNWVTYFSTKSIYNFYRFNMKVHVHNHLKRTEISSVLTGSFSHWKPIKDWFKTNQKLGKIQSLLYNLNEHFQNISKYVPQFMVIKEFYFSTMSRSSKTCGTQA